MDKQIEDLLALGFVLIGEWKLDVGTIRIEYRDGITEKAIRHGSPALYAFSVNGKLKYIGKTTRTLRNRLYGYEHPGSGQETNLKCHKNILIEMAAGSVVKVYGFSPKIPLFYDRFKIDLSAGLEDALIKDMKPKWNGKQDGKRLTETEMNEKEIIDQ